jgi:hypothetical protein
MNGLEVLYGRQMFKMLWQKAQYGNFFLKNYAHECERKLEAW